MVLVKLLSRTSDKSAKSNVPQPAVSTDGHLTEPASQPPVTESAQLSAETRPSVSIYSSDTRPDGPTPDTSAVVTPEPLSETSPTASSAPEELKPPTARPRRFSWRGISLFNGGAQDEHKHAISPEEEQRKKAQVAEDRMKRAVKVSSADRKARESAIIVRSLIVGQSTIVLGNTKGKPLGRVAKPKISKVKAELMQPKKANRVIAHLRTLPPAGDELPPVVNLESAHAHLHPVAHPIHAVCLPVTDAEADEQHFSKLTAVECAESTAPAPTHGHERAIFGPAFSTLSSVYNTSITQLEKVLAEMHVVSLLADPSLGLGLTADKPGLLAGAVPSAKTVIQGVEQITPQLMSLGYATGKVLLPDHSGIYPPKDRMSVLTYWWGFEVVLPPPSIEYLSRAPSIGHSVINVLTALAVLNGGVREILPFVRYISTFIDTEFNMIKQEDQGKGVVCAATWLIPAALVPRPWDFPDAPIVTIQPAPAEPTETTDGPSEPTHVHHEPSISLPNPHSEEPPAVPHSPTSPTSPSTSPAPSLPPLPASPTLLAPLPRFDSTEVPQKATEDAQTNGEATAETKQAEKPGETDVPSLAIVPPTPPASNTLNKAPEELTASDTAEAIAVVA